MKQIIIYIVLYISLLSCVSTVKTEELIKDVALEKTEILADGTTVVVIKVELNEKLTQRKVRFEVDRGFLIDSKDGNVILVDAEMENQQLFAKAKLRAPSTPGLITINIQSELPDRKGLNVVTKTITAKESVPQKLELKANSFQVFNNFDGEIELSGQLYNAEGKGVSNGYRVKFNVPEPTKSAFRNENLISTNSKISATFSPGLVAPEQFLTISGTVLDGNGNDLKIPSNELKIYVTQKK